MNTTLLEAGLLAVLLALPMTVYAQEMDHSQMDHSKMAPDSAQAPADEPAGEAIDHSKMDHSKMDHSKMDHSSMNRDMSIAPVEPKTPIPVITDADRSAAFPELDMAHDHGGGLHGMLLFDRFEAWTTDSDSGIAWNVQGWYGSDLNRAWLRSEGESSSEESTSADVELLYGRSVSAWWDAVAGIRHDFNTGGAQDFLAIGVIGMAPYKFEVNATAYIGTSGQNGLRMELEYETLFTARWMLQSSIEANLYSKDDPDRGVGQGLNTLEAGLRMRYEIKRQFAPYVGVVWDQAYGQTADYRRDEGLKAGELRWVAGFRIWF
jgi:copper resistance protein B